jgi:hypothetical protein
VRTIPLLCFVPLLLACAQALRAQEATFTPSATQPSVGRVIVKHLITFDRYDNASEEAGPEGRDVRFTTTAQLGITPTLSASLEIPFVVRRVDDEPESRTLRDLGDLRLGVKWRFWQHDPGPVDTLRLAARAGVELPTGADGLSSDGVDPYVGLVFMAIVGRHGFNQSLEYTMTTDAARIRFGPGGSLADVLRFDSAYLFRLAPEEYDDDTAGSLYAMLELSGAYETNGDTEVLLSPGLLWEAPNYALEAAIRVPVHADLEHRPEREVSFAIGIRFLF